MARFSVEAVFKAIDKITAPVSKMANKIQIFTGGVERGMRKVNRRVDSFLGGMRRAGTVAVIGLALVAGAMGDVIRTGARFEQQIVIAAQKMGDGIEKGSKKFRELEAAARKAGRTTEFTATQSAEALKFLAQAGFDADQAIAALPRVIDFATASETDLATATRIATKSMGAFQILQGSAIEKMQNMARVTDIMVKTSNSANTTLEEMFDAIRNGAAVARKANASIEDTALIIAALADVGIDAAAAGVGIRQIMLAIGAPTSDAARVMGRLGVQTRETIDGVVHMRKPIAVLKDFSKAMKKIDPGNRLPILEAVFGRRAAAKAIGLIDQADSAIDELAARLKNYQGTTERVAARNRDTVIGSFKELVSAIESVKLSIFEADRGPIKDILVSMTKWVRANEELIASNIGGFFKTIRDNWPFIVKVSKAFAVLVVVVGSLIIALKTVIAVMTVVNLVMAANPVGLIATAISLLIVLLFAAAIAVIFFSKELTAWWDNLGIGWKIIIGLIGGPLFLLTIAAAKLKESWSDIKWFFGTVFDVVIVKAEKLLELLNSIASMNPAAILGNLSAVLSSEDENEPEKIEFGRDPRIQTVGPAARAAMVKSTTERQISELTIRDETGRAELTKGVLGSALTLMSSGAF